MLSRWPVAGIHPYVLSGFDIGANIRSDHLYLRHQKAVEKHLKEGEAKCKALRQASRAKNPELYERLARVRQNLSGS